MIIGHKHTTEAMGFHFIVGAVGEHCNWRRRCTARYAGAITKENVGISNDNAGEKPALQKTKVSPAMLISRGSVGT